MLRRDTVSVSLNEVEALTAKAARGAGAGWGMAEDVARAVRWMARHGLDWEAPLLRLLGSGSMVAELAPVFEVGDRLAGAEDGEVFTLDSAAPVWVLAILAGSVYGRALGVDVAAGGQVVRLQPDGRVSSREPLRLDALGPDRVAVTVSGSTGGLSHGIDTVTRRRPIAASAWHALEDYAAHTYVKPTLRSRVTGAGGAGSTTIECRATLPRVPRQNATSRLEFCIGWGRPVACGDNVVITDVGRDAA